MDSKFSSNGKAAGWVKLIVYSAATWFVLAIFIPWIYDVVPPLRHSRDQQYKYDISAGAIYYTDVPISLDSEMLSREAVSKAMDQRAAQLR